MKRSEAFARFLITAGILIAVGAPVLVWKNTPLIHVTDITLTFDKPGIYTFFCTRWCGVNHWRMRGTIEVSGPPLILSLLQLFLFM